MSTDETRALWDAEAPTFDDEPDHGLGDPATRAAWRELLLEHLPPAPARIADLGCGTGTLSVLLAQEGYDVRGVDLSPEMVTRAEAKAAAAGAGATFAVGDASDPDLPAGEFDVVLSRHVLWALPDPAAGLARWVTLLAPAGRLLLVEGRWFTGGGLTAADTEALVHDTGRSVAVRHLPEPIYWGKTIDDERYLAVSVG
ncbi:MAG: class I SAM-dependent methyltransferase [Nocardioides sp.]